MNVCAKFDEIPSMILQDIKETKRYGHSDGRSVGRTVGQRENSIPSHKQSLRGYNNAMRFAVLRVVLFRVNFLVRF